jgi:hypothetical protein
MSPCKFYGSIFGLTPMNVPLNLPSKLSCGVLLLPMDFFKNHMMWVVPFFSFLILVNLLDLLVHMWCMLKSHLVTRRTPNDIEDPLQRQRSREQKRSCTREDIPTILVRTVYSYSRAQYLFYFLEHTEGLPIRNSL